MSDTEILKLHQKFIKLYKTFSAWATLDIIYSSCGTKMKYLKMSLVPLWCLLACSFCVCSVFFVDHNISQFYSGIFVGGFYQAAIKFYILFIGHSKEFEKLLNFMESLTEMTNIPFIDRIRREKLTKSINFVFLCAT